MSLLTTVNRAKQTTCFVDVGTTYLTNILTAASNIVENYCDRIFTSATYTEVRSGVGVDWLYLDNAPITALTSVTIKDCSGTDYNIATSDFSYDADSGKLQFAVDADGDYIYFPKGNFNITIVYTAGYASDSIPQDIQEAVIQVAKNLYAPMSIKDPGLKSEKIGEWSASYGDISSQVVISPIVEAMLMPYKSVSVC